MKQLAKINSVYLGYGGYQGAQFGLFICFSGKGFGVCWDLCTWGIDTEHTENCKWTEAERCQAFVDIMRKVNELLLQAKKKRFDELAGVPVELTFMGDNALLMPLESWRILEEVL